MHAALAGFNVPAQRALWMAGVVALAFVSGRSVAPSVVLAWALGLVLLLDPWAVVSAGFWLSFCAVAAILLCDVGTAACAAIDERRDGARRDDGCRVAAFDRASSESSARASRAAHTRRTRSRLRSNGCAAPRMCSSR